MPSYTYNVNIPAGSDNPSNSQPQMQTNCNSIDSILNVDMIGFNTSNGGYHSKVTLVAQGSDPAPVATTGLVYTKNDSNLIPQLFYENTSGTVIQLTGSSSSPTANGYVPLAGGLTLQYGLSTVSNPGVTTTFPIAFTTGPYSLVTQIRVNGLSPVGVYNVSTTQFTAIMNSGSGTQALYWMAIGVV